MTNGAPTSRLHSLGPIFLAGALSGAIIAGLVTHFMPVTGRDDTMVANAFVAALLNQDAVEMERIAGGTSDMLTQAQRITAFAQAVSAWHFRGFSRLGAVRVDSKQLTFYAVAGWNSDQGVETRTLTFVIETSNGYVTGMK